MAQHLELVTAYRLARRGQPQVVTIEGEPGIGKTRLAKEFLAWAAAQGADVWQGRAYEMGGLLPYQPVVEVLRQRLGRVTDLSEVLSDTWLAELSRLLPELNDRNPELPAPLKLDEAEARTRLFEAVARFGQALADRAPLSSFWTTCNGPTPRHWMSCAIWRVVGEMRAYRCYSCLRPAPRT